MTHPLQHPDVPAGTQPLWWRAPAVAALIGISSETMLKDIAAGRLPLRLANFGERGDCFVLKADVLKLLREMGLEERT